MEVVMSEGSRRLRAWLGLNGSPSQRQLAAILPRVTQPMISNHTRGQQPPLRAIFMYEALTGIPPHAWLSESDREEVQGLSSELAPGPDDLEDRLSVLQAVAETRAALERALLTAPRSRRRALRSAANSLAIAEGDLAQ